jgi:hypothetical protein
MAKKTKVATAMTQSALSIEWAALRERPRPALISASPEAASGTSRMKKRHRADAVSLSVGAGRLTD